MADPAVAPPLPAKLRSKPQRRSIGSRYADEATFEADLAAWYAEHAARALQVKERRAAKDKQRERSGRKRGTNAESDSARRVRQRSEQRRGLCALCNIDGVELISNRHCTCSIKVCRLCLSKWEEYNVCPGCERQTETQRMRHQRSEKQLQEQNVPAALVLAVRQIYERRGEMSRNLDVSGRLESMKHGSSKRDGKLPDELRSLNFHGTDYSLTKAATRIVKREWKAARLPVHTPVPKTVKKGYSRKSMSAMEARRGRSTCK